MYRLNPTAHLPLFGSQPPSPSQLKDLVTCDTVPKRKSAYRNGTELTTVMEGAGIVIIWDCTCPSRSCRDVGLACALQGHQRMRRWCNKGQRHAESTVVNAHRWVPSAALCVPIETAVIVAVAVNYCHPFSFFFRKHASRPGRQARQASSTPTTTIVAPSCNSISSLP